MAAKVVRLLVSDHAVVRIARPDDAEFIRVITTSILHPETVLVSFAYVATVDLGQPVDATQQIIKNFKVGELIIRRKARMRFRCAFKLADLRQRLVVHPVLGPRRVDRTSFTIDVQRKHHPVRQIGIVGDR